MEPFRQSARPRSSLAGAENILRIWRGEQPQTHSAVRDGELTAVVAQNPLRMGYLGVKAAVDSIKGNKVEPSIDTGEILITKENVDSEDVKALF